MRNRILYALLTVAIIVIAIVGLSRMGGAESNMLYTNTADSMISEVIVSDGTSEWAVGNLDSLESRWLQERVQGEGPVVVSWKWKGQTFEGFGCDSKALEGQLEIDGQSVVVVDCR